MQNTIYIEEPFQQNQMQELDPEKYKDYSLNIDVGDIPADLHYVLVLPFSAWEATWQSNNDVVPFIVTYNDDDTRVIDIIQQLKQMDPGLKKKQIQLTFRNQHYLCRGHSIRDLKKQLRTDSIDGVCLFMNLYDKNSEDSDEDLYIDESSILTYITNQKESGNLKYFELMVQIQLKNKDTEMMPLQVDPNFHGDEIYEAMMKKIKFDYGLTVTEADIKELSIKGGKGGKEEDNIPVNKVQKFICQSMYDKSTLVLELKKPPLKMKKIITKDYNSFLTIFKEGQKDPQSFTYSDIANFTFENLYQNQLQLAESQKKDAVYSLKIEDMIIGPKEKISKAEAYFKSYSNQPLNVVGKVVTEKMIFYHHIPKLIEKRAQFSFENLKIPEQEAPKRKQYRNQANNRANQTQNAYFKKMENVEPILIYTSELKYLEPSSGEIMKIYESLNKFLREKNMLTLNESEIESQWRYLYASTLLRHLQKIHKYSGTVYRGVTYDPKAKVGNIMTFKPFLSTSTAQQKAIEFAKKGTGRFKHMFEFQVLEGFPIKEYSIFTKEEEVLLEPFTEFKVKNIKQKTIKGDKFKIYQLVQVPTSKQLPMIRSNLIVWIDPNTKEARQIYDTLVKNETTYLTHILSTKELKEWINKNAEVMKDPETNVIFVTNMSRKQGNDWNGLAGIEGLKEIRKVKPRAPVFFYIGDINKTIEKFHQNNMTLDDVKIGNSPKEVRTFLNDRMKIS